MFRWQIVTVLGGSFASYADDITVRIVAVGDEEAFVPGPGLFHGPHVGQSYITDVGKNRILVDMSILLGGLGYYEKLDLGSGYFGVHRSVEKASYELVGLAKGVQIVQTLKHRTENKRGQNDGQREAWRLFTLKVPRRLL